MVDFLRFTHLQKYKRAKRGDLILDVAPYINTVLLEHFLDKQLFNTFVDSDLIDGTRKEKVR